MSSLPAYITTSDQQAIAALIARLQQTHGRVLVSLTLFGSKARGDDTPDSDIDVLVIINSDDWVIRSEITRIGARVSLEQEVLFNLFNVSESRWAWMKGINHPLYRQILQDGISLPLAMPELQL